MEARYGVDHVVARGLRLAWPRLLKEFAAVEELLAASGQPQPR